ncbi:MAG: peptide deformylase [Geobacteraceae bacterium]|nr:peptide deformylase [Geobacteraceae bacterium]
MAKLKIKTYPDPVLKKKTAPVTDFGPAMQKLLDDMIETMYVSDGVGLAAPQVGISQHIFVASPAMRRGSEYVMINTVIEKREGAAAGAEGCLSLPGLSAEIVRATQIRISFQDRHGKKHAAEVSDFFARVIQHEMDHLNGLLLVDHFAGAEREKLLAQYDALKHKGM